MFDVYVIKSTKEKWYYVGLTSNLDSRIKRHNSGRSKSTKPYKPFILIFRKTFESRKEAREYEKYLKISSNKENLIESLKH